MAIILGYFVFSAMVCCVVLGCQKLILHDNEFMCFPRYYVPYYVPSAQEVECHRQTNHPPCHRTVCRWYVRVDCMYNDARCQIYTRSIIYERTYIREILAHFEHIIGLQIIQVFYVRCRCRALMYVQCYPIRSNTDILVITY